MKRIGKILLYLFIILVVVMVVLTLALRSYSFQNKIVDRAAKWLSEKTDTDVTVDNISIDFFTHLNLDGVLVAEKTGDTIAYLDRLQVDALDLLRDERVVKNVTIEGVDVRIERNAEDGGYNIDKIINAFGSTDTAQKSSEPLALKLEKIQVREVRAKILDRWKGQDHIVELGEALIDIESLDFEKKRFKINTADLTGAKYLMAYHTPSPKYVEPNKNNSDHVRDTASQRPHLEVAKLSLEGGGFELRRYGVSAPSTMTFDPNHIDISDIHLDVDDLHTADGAILADIKKLSADEKSGIGIRDMHTYLSMSQAKTHFADAYIQLNQSLLKGQLDFDYGSISNLADFIEKVKMDLKLVDSRVASDDVAVFTNALLKWNIFAGADLHFVGTVADYVVDVSKLYTERGTKFVGRIAMQGLPDMDRAMLNIHADQLSTDAENAAIFAPELRDLEAVNLNALGQVNFVGDFVGRYLDFDIRGKVLTRNGGLDIGRFYLDMFTPGDPKYGGVVDFENLNLYGFLPDLPMIKGHGHVVFDAVGVDPDKLYVDLDSKLKNVHYDGQDYANIDLVGRATTKGLEAQINSKNEKLDGNFDLKFDMTSDYELKLLGDFRTLDLYAMGLSTNPFVLHGLLDADLAGDFTKSIIGYARLSDARVEYKDSSIQEDFIRVTADTEEDEVYYAFETPTIQSSLDGKFMLADLPDMFQNVIYRYLPAYTLPKYAYMKPDNYANLAIMGSGLQKYINLFMPELVLSDSLDIIAFLDAKNFSTNGFIPFLKYQSYMLRDLTLDLEGDDLKLDNNITSSELLNDDAQLLNSLSLTATMQNNSINLLVNTTDNNQNLNTLQSNLVADNDTFKFQLLPSSIFLNDRKWDIISQGRSYLSGEYLDIAHTEVGNGLGNFVISSKKELNRDRPPLSIMLEDFDIRNILDFLDTDLPDLQSIATGELVAEDPLGDMLLDGHFKLNDMTIEGQSIGDLNLDADYDSKTQKVEVLKSSGIVYDDTYIKLYGDVLLDSTQTLGMTLEASEYDIAPFEPFVDDYLQNLQGNINGVLNVSGTLAENIMEGDMYLNEASFLVKDMGNTYRIPVTHLTFDNMLFETDTTLLYDEDQNVARMYGLIGHENFENFNFSIDLWSDKFRCLNTTAEDNEVVYGNVVASLNALVFGTLQDLVLGLSIEPVQLSEVTAVNVAGDASGGLDGINFRGVGDFLDSAIAQNVDTNKLKLQVNAKVSPLLKANYIISQVDNSSLSVRGNGDVSVDYTMGKALDIEPLQVYGGFEVTEGKINYLNSNNFELSQIAGVKIFDIDEGTSVILNGDPMNARISGGANTTVEVSNLEGMFTAEALDEIKRSLPAARNEIYKSQEVLIGVELEDASIDDLESMKYIIQLPEVKSTTSEVNVRLAEINADQNEASKQVMSLLILNSFLSEDNMSTRMVLNSAIGNTANIFTSRISSSLNQSLKNVTKLDNLDVGLGLRFENDSSSLLNEQSLIPVVNFNGRLRFLDDRLVLKVGYDINVANYGQTSQYGGDNVITGDYKLEYKLDQGQDLEAYVYRNSSYDPLASSKGKINRSGLGLSYSVGFDRFHDLFRHRRVEARKEEETSE